MRAQNRTAVLRAKKISWVLGCFLLDLTSNFRYGIRLILDSTTRGLMNLSPWCIFFFLLRVSASWAQQEGQIMDCDSLLRGPPRS